MTYFLRGVLAASVWITLLANSWEAQADREVAFVAGNVLGAQLTPVATKLAPGLVTAQLTVEPQATVKGYTNCNAIASPGYVSSITAMQWYVHNRWVDENAPAFASSWAVTRVGTPMQAPAQPQPQPSPPTYPRTPFQRILPKNPYVCNFGSATVRPLIGSVKSGEQVVLVVTSFVWNRNVSSFVEDTYQLPGAGTQPVTFPNVAVRALWVGFETSTANALMDDFKRRNLSGSLVGYQTFYKGAPGSRLPCLLKSVPNSQGPGAISCPAGTKWPT